MTTRISTVHAREVLDSRGNPTVEAFVTLAGGTARFAPSTAPPTRRASARTRSSP